MWGREGRKQESRAADALMAIRLCCCLLETGVRRGEGGERGGRDGISLRSLMSHLGEL